jgi:tRNA threonylcarbamoyladenosine biosynthesis protein TsaB
MPEFLKFLAFDTSTEQMTVAVTDGARVWQHSGPGGAQASVTLIPALLALLAESGLALSELDAIVFGRGPGSFTGLRTACAVAQGLALGANKGAGLPVLPIDTLLAVAEEARFQWVATKGPSSADLRFAVTALLDARMHEMYVQGYEFRSGVWGVFKDCTLIRPEDLALDPAPDLLAGNVFDVYAERLPAGLASLARIQALPTASALLRLAPALAAAGQCVDAALALPLYIRDKVALTTEERARLKAAVSGGAELS